MTDDRAEFIEQVGVVLGDMGIPRMGAKAFAALLTAAEGGLTARELSEQVSASPAAISGAMRMLTQFRMVSRTRRPGERADRYSVGENIWEAAITAETQAYGPIIALVDRGLAGLELPPEARERMIETRDFFEFFTTEMPNILDRWRESRPDR